MLLMAALLVGIPASYGQLVGIVAVLVANSVAAADMQFVTRGRGQFHRVGGAAWETDYLVLTSRNVTVGQGSAANTLHLEALEGVVIHQDSFAVVRQAHFALVAKGKEALPPATVLGRRLWRRPQVELLSYRATAGELPLLRFVDGKAAVLPKKPRDFRAAMLLLVGDHPILAQQLKGGESALQPEHLRQILEVYLRWKPAGFDTTAFFAAAAGEKGE